MSVFISDDRTTLTEGFEQTPSQHNGEPTTDSHTSKKTDLARLTSVTTSNWKSFFRATTTRC